MISQVNDCIMHAREHGMQTWMPQLWDQKQYHTGRLMMETMTMWRLGGVTIPEHTETPLRRLPLYLPSGPETSPEIKRRRVDPATD